MLELVDCPKKNWIPLKHMLIELTNCHNFKIFIYFYSNVILFVRLNFNFTLHL